VILLKHEVDNMFMNELYDSFNHFSLPFLLFSVLVLGYFSCNDHLIVWAEEDAGEDTPLFDSSEMAE